MTSPSPTTRMMTRRMKTTRRTMRTGGRRRRRRRRRRRDGRPGLPPAPPGHQRARLQVLHDLGHLLREPRAHRLDGVDARALVVRGRDPRVHVGARHLQVRSQQPQILERSRVPVHQKDHVLAVAQVRQRVDYRGRVVGGYRTDRFRRGRSEGGVRWVVPFARSLWRARRARRDGIIPRVDGDDLLDGHLRHGGGRDQARPVERALRRHRLEDVVRLLRHRGAPPRRLLLRASQSDDGAFVG
mmetsp:Transcript_9367/g.42487  ORF Transcript_9367/g.42487 Transcript_9367/m.42487 type:complete len:242 (-) Transcript_9367:2139-2864(-)